MTVCDTAPAGTAQACFPKLAGGSFPGAQEGGQQQARTIRRVGPNANTDDGTCLNKYSTSARLHVRRPTHPGLRDFICATSCATNHPPPSPRGVGSRPQHPTDVRFTGPDFGAGADIAGRGRVRPNSAKSSREPRNPPQPKMRNRSCSGGFSMDPTTWVGPLTSNLQRAHNGDSQRRTQAIEANSKALGQASPQVAPDRSRERQRPWSISGDCAAIAVIALPSVPQATELLSPPSPVGRRCATTLCA